MPADRCTELTCPHHGAANREAVAARPACEWFRWIGQPFSSCDRCGRPAWEHRGEETYAGSGPFDTAEPVGREWEPGEVKAIREKWGTADE